MTVKAKKKKIIAPRTLTCTLTYPGSHAQLTWTPSQPTSGDFCRADDTIVFQSPDVRSVLTFGVDSPFEAAEGPKAYEVKKGATLTKVVDKRFERAKLQLFKFICSPDGIVVPGSGGTVPVGSGGN